MGLDISHDAFHGPYTAFNRFRQAVAEAIGGSFPPHHDKDKFPEPWQWYWGEGYGPESHPGLYIFFMQSDSSGEIYPDDCLKVANDLEALLPKIDRMGLGEGWGGGTRTFIAGCRKAHQMSEPLEFG